MSTNRRQESWWRKLSRKRHEKRLFAASSTRQVFEWIHATNKWGDPESVSGSGSNLAQTASVRAQLPALLQRHRVRTLLDAPCGDWFWMRHTTLDLDMYIGADIVQALVDANNASFGSAGRRFVQLDLVADTLPRADLLLCRDCLVHLDYDRIRGFLANLRRSAIPLLLTTTHSRQEANVDKLTGQHRFLNLQLPPFNWPAPIDLIVEDVPVSGRDTGKSLALWPVAGIPDF
ncbi:MAG: class I SAM-dependent methyltransferase [Pseudomonadales bacterium]